MIKWLISLLLVLWTSSAFAASTYYVLINGGTSTQCTGLTNAAYPGTGVAQDCAFNHPAWAIGSGTTAKMVGGDTLIIDVNSYMIGYGMPNTSGFTAYNEYAAILNQLPSGPDAAHPTRVLGSTYNTGCATRPELWGTQSAYNIFDLSGRSNIDIECLELTDHSTCGRNSGGNQCSASYGASVGTYARDGIDATGGTNFTFKNLDIHGFAQNGMNLGGINGLTMMHVDLTGNHTANWNGDVGETGTVSSFSGSIVLDHLRVRFSGCREAYPRANSFTTNDYNDCTVKADGGYGDGAGFFNTAGNWVITNSEFSHNASDGLDLLYATNQLNLSIDKSLFEGNAGNQLKFTAHNLSLTNSIIIANCDYFNVTNKAYNTSTFETCRANGTPISAVVAGGVWKIANVTAYTSTGTGGSAFLEATNGGGYCTGTETYTYKNNVLVSNHSPTNWIPYYSGLAGSCLTAWNASTTDHSVVYNFQTNPSGTGNVFTSPLWTASISSSASSNVSNITLTNSSPAKGTAASTTYWNTSTDYNNFTQNSPLDMGAIQYGSSTTLSQAGQTCTATSDCAAGTCSSFACTGSCTANGGSCSVSDGSTCCSSYCSSSICGVPNTCGDAAIQTGETCDTTNLNGANCITQGYTGGSLTCASDCKSYVTSSCTNTLVFPLTPILDTFTRANSTGISNTSWTNLGGSVNISSNAALPIVGSGGYNWYAWAPSAFTADEEVYATISTKGSNGDDLGLFLRANFSTGNDYKLEPDPVGNFLDLYKHVNGASTRIAHISQAFASGDSYGLSAVGSTITVYYKASAGSWTNKSNVTDTSITGGGNLGFASYTGAGATPDLKFTNFGGGSLNPITCGNGLKEGAEVCDGTDLAGQTCITKGFASGTLSCATDCNSFTTTSCVSAAVCGNNIKESGEVCDGTDLASATCATLGYLGGTLSCTTNCLALDTTRCVGQSRTAGSSRGFASNRGFTL